MLLLVGDFPIIYKVDVWVGSNLSYEIKLVEKEEERGL